jgi:hypothetical protein
MCYLFSLSCLSRVLFRTRWRAGSRVVRAGRTCCFVCRQRAMSRMFARRLHVVMLGSPSSRCLRVPRVVRARSRAVVLFHACISPRSANSSRLESLIFKLFI